MLELDFTRFPVLVVDDEQDNLDAFRFAFRKAFTLQYALGGNEALAILGELDAAVIVADQRMPGMSGIQLLQHAVKQRPDTAGILLTAYTDLPVLLEAINSGAVHRYVQKPWDSKELTVILRQAIERFFTLRENRRLREQVARYATYLESQQRDPMDFGELLIDSPPMKAALAALEALPPDASPVLVRGERGTERELIARAMHVGSTREGKPYVTVRCAGRTDEDLSRELFGWNEGAFEGALRDNAGRLELADGGTVVLEDLRTSTPDLEERLFRLLESGTIERLGGTAPVRVNVRVVVSSTDGPAEVWKSRALADRLSSFVITVPPLRDRRADIPLLATKILAKYARKAGRPARELSREAVQKLSSYGWPGNVEELARVLEVAAIGCVGPILRGEHIALPLPDHDRSLAPDEARIDLPTQLDEMERRELCAALARCGGNKAEVARMLGIQRTTLYYRLKRLGIEA